MKQVQIYLILFLLILFGNLNAQTFQDSPSNEPDGNFPSKWDLVQGTAEIKTFEAQKVIYFGNKSIITPLMDSKNYLSDTFTLEFDAYFDNVEKAMTYQYYLIRFWEGSGEGIETNSSGSVVTFPLKIYRHGANFEQTLYSPQVSKERYNEFKQNLQGNEGIWSSIAINYSKLVCKVFIDGEEIITINNPKFFPKMISIEGVYLQFNQDYMRAIKNINISGIKIETNENNTTDTDTANTDATNTEMYNYAYNLPKQDGMPNQILQTDGNGTVNWIDFHLIGTEPHTHENTSVENTNTETTNTSSGLEAIDEGDGTGWRLKGRDPNNYGNIGLNAVDLSQSQGASTSSGAIGSNSIAIGFNTIASGFASVAIGSKSNATGILSTAFGFDTKATGYNSTAMGYNTRAEAFKSTAIGNRNVGGGNPDAWEETDPLFEVGNGNQSNLSNAFSILKNGTVTAPSFDVSEITDPKALITKEYADANYSTNNTVSTTSNTGGANSQSSGLEAIDEGNGIGWRLKGRDPNNYGNIGKNAVDLSFNDLDPGGTDYGATGNYSLAFGFWAKAKGNNSFALGAQSKAYNGNSIAIGASASAMKKGGIAIGVNMTAHGEYSTALGYQSLASGNYSTVFGNDSKAIGFNAFAIGSGVKASGEYSTAIGNQAITEGKNSVAVGFNAAASGDASIAIGHNARSDTYCSIAFGPFNVGGGDSNFWIETDPLFEIGNGDGYKAANALTVLKNGNIGIGTHTPQVKLHINEGTDASLSSGGYIIIGDKHAENLVFDNNEIMARNNVQPSTLYLQHNGGDVFVGGKVVHSSDKRLKRDVENLSYGLNEILQLRPVSYNWKFNPESPQKSIGLIAQEVQPLINEIVTVGLDKDKTLSISYTELIPVLIKAIQEQQTIINNQNKKIDDLTAESNSKDNTLNELGLRIEQIELLLKNDKL